MEPLRIGWFESIFIWLGGYSPKTMTDDDPEDREPISKIGGAILFAALIAVLNWGIAGWTYTEGSATYVRLVVAVISAIFGMAIVLVFDRGFVYLTDTAGDTKRFKFLAYALFRVVVILAVGSVTAQAVMPLVLGSELKAHALHMVEEGEQQRRATLNKQFNVEASATAVKEATAEIQRLQSAMSTIPVDIQRRQAAARNCWTDYVNQKSRLISSGVEEADARHRVSFKAVQCSRDTKAAAAERDAYLTHTRNQLTRATDNQQTREADLTEITSTVKSRIVRAKAVEQDSFTPRSSAVLWSLLVSNPGARVKWIIISFLLLICELLPIIQRLQAGQSNVGKRIATDRRLRTIKNEGRLQLGEHEFAVLSAVHRASLAGIEQAKRSPKVEAVFANAFAANIAAFAPIEAVLAMMRDLEARHVDVNDFMRRYPRYASVISQSWANAIKTTTSILNKGMGDGSTVGA